MGADEQNLLIGVAVAAAVSFGTAWLILRSMFKDVGLKRLVSASALVVLYPYAALLVYAVAYAVLPIGAFEQWDLRWYMMDALAVVSAVVLIALWWALFVLRPKAGHWTQRAVATAGAIIGLGLVAWRRDQLDAERVFDSLSWATPVVLPAGFLFATLVLRSAFAHEPHAKAIYAAILVAQFACALVPLELWLHSGNIFSYQIQFVLIDAVFVGLLFFGPTAALLFIFWLFSITTRFFTGERDYMGEAIMGLLLLAVATLWSADAMWSTYDKL